MFESCATSMGIYGETRWQDGMVLYIVDRRLSDIGAASASIQANNDDYVDFQVNTVFDF